MKLIPLYKEIDLCKFDGDSILWCRPAWVDDAMRDGTLRYNEAENMLYRKSICVGEPQEAITAGNYIAKTDDFVFFMTKEQVDKLREFYRVKPQE